MIIDAINTIEESCFLTTELMGNLYEILTFYLSEL
jgi:hypothetical protein